MKEFLSQNNIRFAYMDISTSMIALKQFLKIRDTSPSHEPVREKHSVGIPCLVVDDQIFITETTDFVRQLIEDGVLSE